MKQQLLPLLIVFMTIFQARPSMPKFTYEYEGQILTYRVTDFENKSCKVVNSDHWIIGAVKIPTTVILDDTEYTVTEIGQRAFYQGNRLTSIIIPETVTTIGKEAFLWSTHLTSINIPKSVTSIGEGIFKGCTSLSSIILSESLTKISSYAFSDCTALTSISIPEAVTEIGEGAFQRCTALTSISIPQAVTEIKKNTFYECNSLSSFTIPETVTEIGEIAFAGCNSLSQIIIPPLVNYIGLHAFSGSNLLKVAFPSTLEISSAGFDRWTTSMIQYNPNATLIENGVIYGPEKSSLLFVSLDVEGEFTIPESVMTIGELAFCKCKKLSSIIIPQSVTEIGEKAFADCSSLTSVKLPESLIKIESYSFLHCDQLKSITVPNSVTEIGRGAFAYCSSLTSTEMYAALTKISEDLFYECDSLSSFTIPETVTEIGDRAFFGCDRLSQIIIPPLVNHLGFQAFIYSGVMKVAYPNTLAPIEFDVGLWFAYEIGYPPLEAVFEDGLIYGPERSSILFASIYLEGEFAIPDSVTEIGDDAFAHCSGLTNITIPETVNEIEAYAFAYCSGLTTITIPKSVKYISNGAFFGCNNLTEVNYPATAPIDPYYSIFNEETYSKATLYIPKEAYDKIMTYNIWRNFNKIEFKDFDTAVEKTIDKEGQGVIDPTLPMEIYSLNGHYVASSLANLTPGLYIIHQGNTIMKIMIK